ncbi:hypothetical protein HYALB_00004118 [Hymenoscyphus albidus]|uniref:Probable endonuclease LCL3 n=1 Tax=Hymenoscyphus albidus TaxID=595503 RepID=A0A9N9LKX9_9HELO|nr:hypothetical protein HYALB_00004118 [Hymenoscyphus albidus]
MRWPWSSDPDDKSKSQYGKRKDSRNVTDWSWYDWEHYKDPRTIASTIILTSTLLFAVRFQRNYIRRIPTVAHIRPEFYRKRRLFGTVTSVGDADNFHLFHTPGGRLAGWGWLPGRKVPVKKIKLRDRTIRTRIAGIDAPEGAHFGNSSQPHSKEALQWLRDYILNRRVKAYIYRRDQYDRVVATVWVRKGLTCRYQDVGLEMLKAGYATVYEANTGAEFGEFEEKYRQAEKVAKRKKVGMWAGDQTNYESPRDFKTRTAKPVQ